MRGHDDCTKSSVSVLLTHLVDSVLPSALLMFCDEEAPRIRVRLNFSTSADLLRNVISLFGMRKAKR